MKDNLDEKELIAISRGSYVLGDSTSLKILFELHRFGEKTFTELKHMLDINPSTLSKKLRILEQVDLISVDRSRGGVKVYYSINESSNRKSLRRFVDAFERLSHDL